MDAGRAGAGGLSHFECAVVEGQVWLGQGQLEHVGSARELQRRGFGPMRRLAARMLAMYSALKASVPARRRWRAPPHRPHAVRPGRGSCECAAARSRAWPAVHRHRPGHAVRSSATAPSAAARAHWRTGLAGCGRGRELRCRGGDPSCAHRGPRVGRGGKCTRGPGRT